jgi:uncharacterized protein (TIGR00730 family)
MAKFLRDLLDAEEPLFTQALQQLEKVSGNTGADAKLIADITAKAHESMRLMGLDPTSSTGPEIYQALQNHLDADIKRLSKIIGAHESDDVEYLVPFMIKAADGVEFDRKVFVLKREKGKELLRQMPPEQLMQKLGYTDVDVMFENEDFDEIYTALRFSEGPEWLNRYDELFATVEVSDYEERDLRILQMDHEKYVDLAAHFVQKKLHNVTHTKEMGTIVVVPMHAKTMRGLILKTLPLLLHYMNEVKLYSSFFKLKSKQPHFGKVVMETLIADPGTASQMAGNKIHWRVIQRYLGRHKDDPNVDPAEWEPHVQPEDLHWRRAEDLLYKIDPKLEFWKDRDYVAFNFDDFPVTFNLFDVSFAYSNQEPYEGRYAYHFRESLWNEIFVRYMGFPNLRKQVLESLDNADIAPEKLPVKHKTTVPALKRENEKRDLLIRRRLIDAAEGRLDGVVEEFEKVFEMLGKHDKTVTIYGSARLPQDSEESRKAYEIANTLAKKGYGIVTGGGNGIMEAANMGAFDAGGVSIGLNILLPHEQTLNEFTTENFQFQHFFGRRVAMALDASGYIFLPGGFGTFDELFEILVLIQTKKIPAAPVFLFRSDFWKPFDEVIEKVMCETYHMINHDDLHIYKIVDDIDDIVRGVEAFERSHSKIAPRASDFHEGHKAHEAHK